MEVLTKPIRFLLFFFLLTVALYYGKEVIIPFCFAALLAMLFLPVSRKMESWGIPRGLAAILCLLVFLGVITGIFAVLTWQFADLSKELSGIEQRVSEYIHEIRQYISRNFGVSEEQQKKFMERQQSSGGGTMTGIIARIMSSMAGIMIDFVLVLVYIFLFLFFRSHLRRFIIKLVPATEQAKSSRVISKASEVARQYLTGLTLMIMTLWVMYGIGFSLVGVKHALFFAVLCGLLEIVPFVGNITGTTLTVIATLAQDGDLNTVAGILIVYALVQFIQTYILEPLVVGAEVNINPLSTILVLVIGETLWGVPGMVLAIPLLGIVKIICDHVEPLKPYGYLIGEEKKEKRPGIREKMLSRFGRNK